jgi:hypothetical protein
LLINNSSFDGYVIAEGKGLLQVVSSIEFCFAATLTKIVLGLIQPADLAMQARDCDLNKAIQLIATIKCDILKLRIHDKFTECLLSSKTL